MKQHLNKTTAVAILAILFVVVLAMAGNSFYSTTAATYSSTPSATTIAAYSPESVPSEEAAVSPTPTSAAISPTPGKAAESAIGSSSKRVVLQAGHWKYQEAPAPLNSMTGTSGGGKTEPEVTLAIANEAARILRGWGYTVEIVPTVIPAGLKADLFVAIHADGNTSPNPRGFFTDRPASAPGLSAAESRLSSAIDAEYTKATGIPYVNRSTADSRYYYGYKEISSPIPAVLIETGFLTNRLDQEILVRQPQKAAEGIANGIRRYLGS